MSKSQLSIPPKLNQLTDDVINNFTRIPVNIHILFTPLAIYFNNQYIANKYDHHIRRLTFQNIENTFIKRKNNWNERTSKKSNWDFPTKV